MTEGSEQTYEEEAYDAEQVYDDRPDEELTAEEVFARYDTDNSGSIDIDEFKVMLPYLGILVNEAKAERIFRRFDADGGGDIDFDEFQSAVFSCDTGTSTFKPHQLLTPMDVFETFDRERKGFLVKASFTDALKYMVRF